MRTFRGAVGSFERQLSAGDDFAITEIVACAQIDEGIATASSESRGVE